MRTQTISDSIKDDSDTQSKGIWKQALFPTLFLSVIVIHIGLLLYFEPLEIIFSPYPLSIGDYYGHFYQIHRFIEGMEGWGKTWVYDFQLLAGFPTNAISDANNKAWELWAYALWKLGFPMGTAFNSYLVLAHLLLLPVIYCSARLFDLDRWGVLTSMTLGSALWFFDSSIHICWFAGMASYTFAGYAFLLPVAMFYRYLRDKRFWQVAVTAFLTGILHLMHSYIFLPMALSMGVLYLQAFKKLNKVQHASVMGIIVVVLAMNAYWMLVAVEFFRYLIDSAFYGQSSIFFLISDFFGILLDPMTTGNIGVRTGFRFLCFSMALVMILYWKRSKDNRLYVFAITIPLLCTIAYFGGYSSVTSQVQPYRYIYPAGILSLIPAGGLVEAILKKEIFHGLPRLVYSIMFVLMIPGLQHLARDVLYFFPDNLPNVKSTSNFISSSGYPRHPRPEREKWGGKYELLADWVEYNNDGTGRFLVPYEAAGEQLAWKTNAEIIGGFPYRNLQHAFANMFRPRDKKNAVSSENDLREYLTTYAIKWIIAPNDIVLFEQYPSLLTVTAEAFGSRTYQTLIRHSFFEQGYGNIKASLNKLEVQGTDPSQDLVLRYNWLHTLVCEPNCTITRKTNKFNEVGFIKVPAPHPASFVIRNAY